MAEERWTDAHELLDQIPDYAYTADSLRECAYQEAMAALNDGDDDRAFQLLGSIRDYKDASDIFSELAYRIATKEKEAGNLSEAADIFNTLGNYKDANEQAESSYDDYYKDAYEAAKEAYDAKNWEQVIAALDGLDLNTASTKYADVKTMWQEAAYEYAEQLYLADKPYEAYAYFEQLLDYKDVSTKKITRRAYQVCGTWVSGKGEIFVFNTDGTCEIDGKSQYFTVKNWTLRTGRAANDLDNTYRIVSINSNATRMSLRMTKGSNSGKSYSLTRQTDTPEEAEEE